MDVWECGCLPRRWLQIVNWIEHLVIHPLLIEKSLASEAMLVKHFRAVLPLLVLVTAVRIVYLYFDLDFSSILLHLELLSLDDRLTADLADEGCLVRPPEHVSFIDAALFEPLLDLVLEVLQVYLQLCLLADVLLDFDLACLDVVVIERR